MFRGLSIVPVKRVSHPQGDLLKLISKDTGGFRGFGELYTSEVSPFAIKAWRRHVTYTNNLSVIRGDLTLALIEFETEKMDGPRSKVLELRAASPLLITIPPGLWYGFKAGADGATIMNLIDGTYLEEEVQRAVHDAKEFNFDWESLGTTGGKT